MLDQRSTVVVIIYCIFAGKIRTNLNINAICSFSKPMSCKMNRNLRLHQLHLHEQLLISYVPAHIDTANLSNLCLVKCCETSPVTSFFQTVRPVSSGNHLMVEYGRWNHCLGTPTVSHFLHAVFLESEVFLTFSSGKSTEDVLNGKLVEIWSI